MQNKNKTPPKAHHARTVFASLFGTLAVFLILSSVISVWLNRTLTDTKTYVAVVGPLATKPDIQNFIAKKASEALAKNVPPQDAAVALLPPSALQQTPEQINAQLQPIVYSNVLKVISSPTFATIWTQANQTAHSSLVNQLNSDNDQLQLNLNPVIVAVTKQLSTTDLAPVAGEIEISPDMGQVNLQGTGISKAHSYYKLFKRSTIVIVVAALLSLAASIALSVHHLKTIRRILIATGVMLLLLAASIQAPSIIAIKLTDVETQKAMVVIMQSIFHNLQIASLIGGLGCIIVAIGTKVFEKLNRPSKT